MVNVTTLNTTVIDPGDLAYVPVEVWLVIFFLTFIFFFHAIIAKRNTEISAVLFTVLAGVGAYISGYIEFSTVETVMLSNGTAEVVPVSYISHPSWMAFLFLGMFFIGILVTWKNLYELYFTRQPEWKQRRYK